MKVKVISQFRDINDFSCRHVAGEVLDVDEVRAKKLIELKLVKVVAEPRKRNGNKAVNDK